MPQKRERGQTIRRTSVVAVYGITFVALILFAVMNKTPDQVVAASGVTERCVSVWVNQGDDACTSGNQYLRPYNNQ